jgi:hypothetical protein
LAREIHTKQRERKRLAVGLHITTLPDETGHWERVKSKNKIIYVHRAFQFD